MDDWLREALAYVPSWLRYQLRRSEQAGCLLAVAHQGEVVLEEALAPASGRVTRTTIPSAASFPACIRR